MSVLEQRLSEYLAVRRAPGYKLERAGKLLAQVLADERDQSVITAEQALEWATLPPARLQLAPPTGSRSLAASRRACTRSTRHARYRPPPGRIAAVGV